MKPVSFNVNKFSVKSLNATTACWKFLAQSKRKKKKKTWKIHLVRFWEVDQSENSSGSLVKIGSTITLDQPNLSIFGYPNSESRLKFLYFNTRNRMTACWKLNTYLLSKCNFQNQPLLTIQKELMEMIVGNSRCVSLKNKIRLFNANYSKWINLVRPTI